MEQIGWERLQCDCGSTQFTLTFHIKWRPSGGTTQEPSGFECVQCRTQMDAKYLIDRAEYRKKREALARMKRELESEGVLTTGEEP